MLVLPLKNMSNKIFPRQCLDMPQKHNKLLNAMSYLL